MSGIHTNPSRTKDRAQEILPNPTSLSATQTAENDREVQTVEKKKVSPDAKRLSRQLAIRGEVVSPKNSILTSHEIIQRSQKLLSFILEGEQGESKHTKKQWKEASEMRAKHAEESSRKYMWCAKGQGAWGSASTILLAADKYKGWNVEPIIAMANSGFSTATQRFTEWEGQSTMSKTTIDDYQKDASRSDFENNRENVRQTKQAKDQVISQGIELIRLGAKMYSGSH